MFLHNYSTANSITFITNLCQLMYAMIYFAVSSFIKQ